MADDIQLRIGMGAEQPDTPPREVIDAITGMRVTHAVDAASGFQLTLAVARQSRVHQLLAEGYFDPPLRVVASVAWLGVTTVLMDGVVMRHDLSVGDTGATTLTLTGDDLTALMDLETKVKPHDGERVEDRVRTICGEYANYGLDVDVRDAPRRDDPDPRRRSPTQRGTDLDYLRGLAADVGYVFFLQPGPEAGRSIAYWGPEYRIGDPQPPLSVDFDSGSNVSELTFGFDGRLKTQYIDGDGQPVAADVSTLRPPLAKRPATPLRKLPLPPARMLDDPEAGMLGGAVTAGSSDTVTASGTLDVRKYGGILHARRLVSVRGAGQAYDGLYFVTSVTHDIAPGRYRQDFRLARDGLGAQQGTVDMGTPVGAAS